MTKNASLDARFKWARISTFVLYSILILSFCIWQITRAEGPLYFIWLVQILPLLIFLPGMKTNNPRTYIMLCFVLLMYFVRGVEGVMSTSSRWIDYVLLSISILLFISAMLTSRWAAMHQKNSKKTNENVEVIQ